MSEIKQRLFTREREFIVDGVRFRIRRPTRREFLEKINPLYMEYQKAEDEERKKQLNYEYERMLLKICVIEPREIAEFENPHDEVDGSILNTLMNEIFQFVYVAPFLKSSLKPGERGENT